MFQKSKLEAKNFLRPRLWTYKASLLQHSVYQDKSQASPERRGGEIASITDKRIS